MQDGGEDAPNEQSNITVLQSGSHMAYRLAAELHSEYDRSGSIEFS